MAGERVLRIHSGRTRPAYSGAFCGAGERWRATPHGGVVGLVPDGYLKALGPPRTEEVYAILDAGHTHKLLALGELAAVDILDGP